MEDSCGIDNSARLCLLSLGAHALILNGCLADALLISSGEYTLDVAASAVDEWVSSHFKHASPATL